MCTCRCIPWVVKARGYAPHTLTLPWSAHNVREDFHFHTHLSLLSLRYYPPPAFPRWLSISVCLHSKSCVMWTHLYGELGQASFFILKMLYSYRTYLSFLGVGEVNILKPKSLLFDSKVLTSCFNAGILSRGTKVFPSRVLACLPFQAAPFKK